MKKNWKILPVSKKCTKSGKEFCQGDRIVSVLVLVKNAEKYEELNSNLQNEEDKDNKSMPDNAVKADREFIRYDFLEKYWGAVKIDFYSLWYHTFFSKKHQQKSILSKENQKIYNHFQVLVGETDEKSLKKRLLLAWMLERRKIFKKVKNKNLKKQDKDFIYYENKENSEIYGLKNISISYKESEELYEDLKVCFVH